MTARHVVTEVVVPGHGKRIVLRDRRFTVLDKKDLKHSGFELEKLDTVDFRADVTVFRLWSEDIDFGPPLLPFDGDDVRPTQDVYFLGFPGFDLPEAYGLTPSSTTPLIKRAMVSGQADHYDIQVWLLDGMANHGFSGGPVVIFDPISASYQVMGVISSHAPANVRVNPELLAPDPHRVGVAPLSPSDRFFETNSGIAACFDIKHAIADIDDYLDKRSAE